MSDREADQTAADVATENGVLPEGWALARLGDGIVTDIQPGFACGANNRAGDGVPHLRPIKVSVEGEISLSDVSGRSARRMEGRN